MPQIEEKTKLIENIKKCNFDSYSQSEMKTATIKDLNQELHFRNPGELLELCLRLSKFKKENKELLTYLLFESYNEDAYIKGVKEDIDLQFELINRKSSFQIRKSIRRILLNTKKYIRYSQVKLTEVDLLVYYCGKLKRFSPSIQGYPSLLNLYNRLVNDVSKKVSLLHEDLQFDYRSILDSLKLKNPAR